ncbi:cAMP-regulated phosphoprotein 21-like isoform X2 [Petromyzon marinus]|uniref:cAMP-regulated phosphoprotein 21-like isoform X2 n=1 Tax=Petromyzon marinus TaxID=7757 RepID=UPI003F6E827E
MEPDGAGPAAAVPEEDPAAALPAEWPRKRDGRPAEDEEEEEEEAARRRRKEKDVSAAEAGTPMPQNRSQATGLSRKKSKASGKMRLVRSMAVCEESPPACSPGDGPHESIEEPQARVASSLSVEEEEEEATPAREEEASVENEKPGLDGKATKLLSRDSSQDYTDSTGIDVHEFLVNTLKSSPRDRIMLLKLEQELIDFIHDATQYKKFPQMTSYHRMLVHRVAAYFGMDHNVDQTGKAVVVNKTPGTRIPEQAFNEHFTEEGPSAEAPKRMVPKRDGDGAEQEERKPSAPEYRLAEIRIQEPSPLSSTQKRRQMFRSHRDGSGGGGSSSGEGGGLGGSGSWQSSTETDCGGGGGGGSGTPPRRWGPRPWSSTDSESSHAGPAPARRPAVVKASSFSGISAVLMRGDSHGGLANAGSDSPSSVGTSPTACPARTRHGQQQQQQQPRRSPAAAAVPSYSATVAAAAAAAQVFPAGPSYCLLPLESMGIPPGSILVNPQTGQPFLNPDGTPAVYNPPAVQQQARGQLSESSQLILATAHHQPQGNHHHHHHHMSLSHGQASSPTSAQHPYSQHVVSFSPPQQYSVDELGLHFGHVALSHHSTAGEIPESAAAPYPPPIMHQQQQQQLPTGYGASPSAGPPVTPNGYGGAGSSYPAVAQPQVYALQQQQQQQHQQQQHQQQHQQQIPVFVYAPGQLGLVGQQSCRPATPTQFGGQRGQQHPSQTHGFQGPPPPSQQQFQGVTSVHQQSAGAQHGNDGTQLQGLLLQYPAAAVPSYQVPYQLQAASHSQHHHHHLQQHHQHQQHQQQHQQQQPAPAPRGPSRDGGPHPGSSDDAGRAMPLFCSLAASAAAVPGHGGARAPAGLPQACPGTAGSGGGVPPSAPYAAGVPLPGGCRANYTTAVCVPWTQLRY